MNHGANYKNESSRDFLCCLATSNDTNAIISAKFDKWLYFDQISSGDSMIRFLGLYVNLLFIEVFWSRFWFSKKTLCLIHLLGTISETGTS